MHAKELLLDFGKKTAENSYPMCTATKRFYVISCNRNYDILILISAIVQILTVLHKKMKIILYTV